MRGFGHLETPGHLLEKLRHDLRRVRADPTDQYAAFDFFVTAEHMVDWVLPGYSNKQAQSSLRASEPLLQVVSHIANGSKHFVAEAQRHEHVQHVDAPWVPASDVSPSGVGERRAGPLYVTLDGAAAQALGAKLQGEDVAERVLRFWEVYIAEHQGAGGGPTTR